MPPSYNGDLIFLALGALGVYFNMALDAIFPIGPNLQINQLNDPKVLSKYINEDVDSVAVNEEHKIEEGGGGTGTTRQALIARLKDGRVLYLFAKTAAETMTERVFLNQFHIYDNELSFYQNICPDLVKSFAKSTDDWCPVPKVYYAKRTSRVNFLVILEDTRFRKQGSVYKSMKDSFQLNEVKIIVKEYAMLHALYWRNCPQSVWRYCPKTGKSLGANTPPYFRFISAHSLKQVKEHHLQKLRLHPDIETAFHLFLHNYGKVRSYWSKGPVTLAHGDSHIGNSFYSVDHTRGGLCDFQCVSEEHGLRDISYYLLMTCKSDLLVTLEEEVIRYYLQELQAALIATGKEQYVHEVPTYEEAYFMYRGYSLWTLSAWVMVCGMLGLVKDEFVVEGLQNTFDNCMRLNTLGALRDIIALAK